VNKTKSASTTAASPSTEPAVPDETDLDTITEHALASLAARFTRASHTVQELFETYTCQAQAILTPPQDTATTETPEGTNDEP
jgi:hypothetical protein